MNIARKVWEGVKKGAAIIGGVMQAEEVYDFVQNMRRPAEPVEPNVFIQE